jgi:hypothetical protein
MTLAQPEQIFSAIFPHIALVNILKAGICT